jgi:hypothetical protein
MPEYENAPDYVNDPNFAQPDTAEDMSTVNTEPVYIVDGEDGPNNPIILRVEVIEVIDRGGKTDEYLKDYLGELLVDVCGGFNMAFAKTKEDAEQIAQDWKDQV